MKMEAVTVNGLCEGIHEEPRVWNNESFTETSILVRAQQPNSFGQLEERVIAVRIGKKQMAVIPTYKQLSGKPISVPVFPALWKNGKGFNWQLSGSGAPLVLSAAKPLQAAS